MLNIHYWMNRIRNENTSSANKQKKFQLLNECRNYYDQIKTIEYKRKKLILIKEKYTIDLLIINLKIYKLIIEL